MAREVCHVGDLRRRHTGSLTEEMRNRAVLVHIRGVDVDSIKGQFAAEPPDKRGLNAFGTRRRAFERDHPLRFSDGPDDPV